MITTAIFTDGDVEYCDACGSELADDDGPICADCWESAEASGTITQLPREMSPDGTTHTYIAGIEVIE